MTEAEKVSFYNLYKETIHSNIKTSEKTKPMWRKLFWTTARDSDNYKAGCVDILETNLPDIYNRLKNSK